MKEVLINEKIFVLDDEVVDYINNLMLVLALNRKGREILLKKIEVYRKQIKGE